MENYNIGRFVPQCKPDGRYEEVQCGAGWEYCWCVDSSGMELTGTKTKGWPQCGKTKPHSVKMPYKLTTELHWFYVGKWVLCGIVSKSLLS